ncbi:MAG: TlpA family protein disulfide reductase [Candidatus Cryptobacteroides sp.]
MKNRIFLVAAGFVAMVTSCGEVSDTTLISGSGLPEEISEVAVKVGTTIDTLVAVNGGKFSVSVPTDICAVGTILIGQDGANFIADGTPLTVKAGETLRVTSKYPKLSLQERLNSFRDEDDAAVKAFIEARSALFADTLLTDTEKEESYERLAEPFFEEYNARSLRVLSENMDNAVALFALQNIDASDAELDSLINLLAPAVQEHPMVVSMKESIGTRLATGEGKMFKDFTVNTVVGMSRSIPPQPLYKEVKLSDYVGNGKYVLVDFWSPWCGPCKREMPNIKAVYEKYAGKDFDVLSIAVWEKKGPEVTISTAAELGMTWHQINNAGSVPTDIYGIDGIPHIILFGPDGTIIKRGLRGGDIESTISGLVSAKH